MMNITTAKELGELIGQMRTEFGLDDAMLFSSANNLMAAAGAHLKLCHMNLENELTQEQQKSQVAVEAYIREEAALIGIEKVTFLYDPRGTTVSLNFPSGASNSFTGGWKVPVDSDRFKLVNQKTLDAYSDWYTTHQQEG